MRRFLSYTSLLISLQEFCPLALISVSSQSKNSRALRKENVRGGDSRLGKKITLKHEWLQFRRVKPDRRSAGVPLLNVTGGTSVQAVQAPAQGPRRSAQASGVRADGGPGGSWGRLRYRRTSHQGFGHRHSRYYFVNGSTVSESTHLSGTMLLTFIRQRKTFQSTNFVL